MQRGTTQQKNIGHVLFTKTKTRTHNNNRNVQCVVCPVSLFFVLLMLTTQGLERRKKTRTNSQTIRGEKSFGKGGVRKHRRVVEKSSKCKRLCLRQATGEETEEREEGEKPGEASHNLTFRTTSPVCLPEFIRQNRTPQRRQTHKSQP